MRNRLARSARFLAVVASGAAIFQIGGCSVGGVTNFARNFNPCGSILACDPVVYRFFTSGYRGPGVDPDIDPACTYPPFCANDPFVGNVGNP